MIEWDVRIIPLVLYVNGTPRKIGVVEVDTNTGEFRAHFAQGLLSAEMAAEEKLPLQFSKEHQQGELVQIAWIPRLKTREPR